MQKLFVCPNKGTRQHMDTAAHCIKVLEERLHVTCSLFLDTSIAIYGDDHLAVFSPQEADTIVAIGGDGAVLRAAQLAYACDKPLLGINSGRLGHLCCMQLQDLEDLTREQLDAFKTSARTLLSFALDGKVHVALNDVIIAKEHFGETLELACSLDGHLLSQWRGDGLIVATPTGSTAYNVSAAGPVLCADVPALVMTAICPHNQKVTSHVVSDAASICVRIVRAPNGCAGVFADGVLCGKVSDTLLIQRTNRSIALYTK